MMFTARANSNIAILKYWGKRDERLILPTNNSISFTMDEQLSTVTTVEIDPSLKQDELHLDGKAATDKETVRVTKFLGLIRARAKSKTYARVVSKNSFPKATGMASSASGFAALAAAGAKAYGLSLTEQELSILARQGSGSATRSIFGGAVAWQMGIKKDGSDSHAVQLSGESNWGNLRNVIAILETEEKKVSSRSGMKTTLETSGLFGARLDGVKRREKTIRDAISKCDFGSMAQAIMEESSNMHAVMLDTYPPITYLNDQSREIMYLIQELNSSRGKPVAAYTFDAGPNAHIYTTQEHVQEVSSILRSVNPKRIIESAIGKGIQYLDEHLA